MSAADRVAMVLDPYGMVPCSLYRAKGVTLNALKIYGTLASFQGTADCCWPSRRAIEDRSGVMSHAGYNAGLKWLVDNRWVIVERRGRGKTNIYRVVMTGEIVDNPEVGYPSTGQSGHNDYPEAGGVGGPDSGQSVYITKRPIEKTNSAVAPLKDPLAEKWKQSFLARVPIDHWTNVGRGMKDCNEIAKKHRALAEQTGINVTDLAHQLVRAFMDLKGRSSNEFWTTALFTPTDFRARWPKLVAHLEKNVTKDSLIDEVFGDGK